MSVMVDREPGIALVERRVTRDAGVEPVVAQERLAVIAAGVVVGGKDVGRDGTPRTR